jgi:hypothetical protein
MLEQIKISKLPANIDIADIEIKEGECLLNSYLISKKYPFIDIIEGIIVIAYSDKNAKILQHAWNKINNEHFDVTFENIWVEKEDFKKAKEIRYAISRVIHYSDVSKDKIEFSQETNNIVNELRLELDKREFNKKI